MKTCFVRGSVIRYIHIPPEYIMKDILLDVYAVKISIMRF